MSVCASATIGPANITAASVTAKTEGAARTLRLDSAEGRVLVRKAKLLGFVEGTSLGRVSARAANDPPTLFNLWRRQDFDQPIDSAELGGKVWVQPTDIPNVGRFYTFQDPQGAVISIITYRM